MLVARHCWLSCKQTHYISCSIATKFVDKFEIYLGAGLSTLEEGGRAVHQPCQIAPPFSSPTRAIHFLFCPHLHLSIIKNQES